MSRRIHVLIQGEQFGPYPENEFCQHVADKKILRSDLVWREGLPEWIPAGDLLESIRPQAKPAPLAAPTPPSPPALTPLRPVPTIAGPPSPGVALESIRSPAPAPSPALSPDAKAEAASSWANPVKPGVQSAAASTGSGELEKLYRLGLSNANGEDMTRDDAAAVALFRKAAEAGHAVAECALGYMLEHGRGTSRDESGAASWYRIAAARGDAIAQNNLALMLATGRGVGRDEGEAARWFQRAAEQGVAGAQMNLGLMLAQGRGVAANAIDAFKWFLLASAQGHAAAIKNRDLLQPELTAEQVAEAQKRAVQFVVKREPGLKPAGIAVEVVGRGF